MTDCIFCDIGKGETETRLLFQDDRCFVIRDINPSAPTHLLVIPKQHLTSLTNTDPGYESLLGHLLTVAEAMARQEKVTSSGFRLAVNQGQDAGQHVPHLHLHVLGGKPLPALG